MREQGGNSWWWVLLAGLTCGCSNQDADCLGRVCRKAVDKMEVMAGGKRGNLASSFHSFRATLGEATLDSRVSSRLNWEKTLADAQIQVEVIKPGIVRLQGKVREFQQRLRAADVALATLGVDQVVNDLTVATP
jgi:osmotically-inducible protein OsmY